MVTIFVLPVILAYMALQFDWFNKAATNRGQLLQPVIQAANLIEESEASWKLLYVLPNTCDAACENAVYSIKQTYAATGKESDRVSILFIATESSSEVLVKSLTEAGSPVLHNQQKNVNQLFQSVGLNAIFVADTLHNVVLKYPVTPDKQQAIMDSRDVLADLKKLLKLSRIG